MKNNKPVFRALQSKVDDIIDSDLKKKWQRVVASLGSGVHPSPNDLLACKDLFSKEPYQLSSLTYAHLVSVPFKSNFNVIWVYYQDNYLSVMLTNYII